MSIIIGVFITLIFYPNLRQLIWKFQKPEIYYLEITEEIGSKVYDTHLIIYEDQIVYQYPKYNDTLLAVKIDQIFNLVYKYCGILTINCHVQYDNTYHYISFLAISDWHGVYVKKFIKCSSLDKCPR